MAILETCSLPFLIRDQVIVVILPSKWSVSKCRLQMIKKNSIIHCEESQCNMKYGSFSGGKEFIYLEIINQANFFQICLIS